MSVITLNEGSLFAGRFQVVRCFAIGGMGAVYEVVNVNTKGRYAIKVMKPEIAQKKELRERFLREAQIVTEIDSRYIVKVIDAGLDETTQMLYLVMELLQGQDLGKHLKQNVRFRFEDVVRYLGQTAQALKKIHGANIVHRDLKPENLFLCESDEEPSYIKVVDFGIAKLVPEEGTPAQATQAVGTPLYMAPEQLQPGSTVSPATDIYALGMMAYTLLVGVPYWDDEEQTSGNIFVFVTASSRGPQEAPTVRALRRGVELPPAFDQWFAQATAREQAKRFHSAKAAINGLASALGLPEPSHAVGHVEGSTGMHAISGLPGQTNASQTSPGQTSPGQTSPGRTSPGQIWPSQTGSGPQTGTVVLQEGASTSASGSGFGMSASQPPAGTTTSGPGQTNAGANVIRGRKTGKGAIVAIGLAVCMAAIGAAVVFGRNTGAHETITAATPLPSASSAGPVVAAVGTANAPMAAPTDSVDAAPRDSPGQTISDGGIDAAITMDAGPVDGGGWTDAGVSHSGNVKKPGAKGPVQIPKNVFEY